MQVALVQVSASTDSQANRARIDAALSPLSPHDALDSVVLPEAVMHDFGKPDHDLGPYAETLDGPFVTALAGHAKRLGTTVVAGMFEVSDTALPYNTLVAVGPDERVVAAYRKIHLYDSFGYRESERLSPGPLTPATFEVAGRTLGLLTCYDLRFPEHARLLVDRGADAFVVPAAWVRGALKEDHWLTLLRARAIENTVDVLGVGQCGSGYVGHTTHVDPLGIAVAAGGERPGLVRTHLDPERLAYARSVNPSLANRRLGAVPET